MALNRQRSSGRRPIAQGRDDGRNRPRLPIGDPQAIPKRGPPRPAVTPRRERRRNERFAVDRKSVADRHEWDAEVLGDGAPRWLHLVDQQCVDATLTNRRGIVPADHFRRSSLSLDGEFQRGDTLELSELRERGGKRSGRVIACTDGEIDAFRGDLLFEILYLKVRDAMTAVHQLAAQRTERMDVA
jgi:hypothetical protein